MADNQQTSDPEPTEGNEPAPNSEDGLRKFWEQMDERLDAAIARGVAKHIPKRQPGKQRNDGRLTIPGIIADIMGGPFTPQSKQDK